MNNTKIVQTIIKASAGLLLGLIALAVLAGVIRSIAGGGATVVRHHGTGTCLRVLALAVGVGGPLGAAYLVIRHLSGSDSPSSELRHRSDQPNELHDGTDRDALSSGDRKGITEKNKKNLPNSRTG